MNYSFPFMAKTWPFVSLCVFHQRSTCTQHVLKKINEPLTSLLSERPLSANRYSPLSDSLNIWDSLSPGYLLD